MTATATAPTVNKDCPTWCVNRTSGERHDDHTSEPDRQDLWTTDECRISLQRQDHQGGYNIPRRIEGEVTVAFAVDRLDCD